MDQGDVSSLNQALVDKLIRDGHVHNPAVEAAFRAVPRHLFLPEVPLEDVYRDQAIPTKLQDGRAISSSSQPTMMAIMLEQLELQPGHRVLEIGAGTGYNAALMAHIVGKTGHVVTMDLDEDIVAAARQHLIAAGFDQVEVVCGDGGLGYTEGGIPPYDRIILTVAAWDVSPAWQEQLAPDGRLVLPLSINGPQKSIAFVRENDHLTSVAVRSCGFMPLRGAFAGPGRIVSLGDEPGLHLDLEHEQPVDVVAVYDWLTGPRQDWATGVQARPEEIWGSLILWLALQEPELCALGAADEWAGRGLVPYLFGCGDEQKVCFSHGLLTEAGLGTLMRPPDQPLPWEQPPDEFPFELFVRAFGPDETPARRLLAHVIAWDDGGRRPASEGIRIRVYSQRHQYKPGKDEYIVAKKWTQLVIDWHEHST